MAEYRTLKLCSVKNATGSPSIQPPGVIVEIDDADEVQRLADLGCISPVDEAPVQAVAPTEASDDRGSDLDGDSFAAWLASGAKVGQVIDWIGDDVTRAEVAMADTRRGVQKHIDGMLEGPEAEA